MRRRVAFSAPLVFVVSCRRPIELSPAVDDEPVVATQYEADAWLEQVTLPPHVPTPRELVEHLPPLGPEKTIEEICRNPHNHCNPPPPGTVIRPSRPSRPSEVRVVDETIQAMAESAEGTTIRVARPFRVDQNWRAVFVTFAGQEDPGPPCILGAWDYDAIDCLTARSPMQLVDNDGQTLRIRLIPPPELVERNQRERDAWVERPPAPQHARVIATSVQGDHVVVVLGAGIDTGLDKTMRVRFDAPDGGCEIVRVDRRTTTCTTTLTPDQIKSLGSVEITHHDLRRPVQ